MGERGVDLSGGVVPGVVPFPGACMPSFMAAIELEWMAGARGCREASLGRCAVDLRAAVGSVG